MIRAADRRAARRIVDQVLAEHAAGDDPVMAAAAQQVTDYRRDELAAALTDSMRSVGRAYGRAVANMVNVARQIVAGYIEAAREVLR